jgi:small-conductance mechanosensitive channel
MLSRALEAALLAALIAAPVTAQQGDTETGTSAGTAVYRQNAINAGLGDPPEGLDRSSPRAAVRGFEAAIAAGTADAAAHMLNLDPVPPESQPERGPRLARDLGAILERQVWIDWEGLSARPDAMIETSGSSDPRAGQPRRNVRLAALDAQGTVYDIRLGRYATEGGDPVWLFTPQTVRNLAPLHAALGPRAFEAHIPESLKRQVLGLWLWEWIALPVVGSLIFALGWTVRAVVMWLAGRVRRPFLRRGLGRTGMPLAILVMAVAAQVVLAQLVTFSGPVSTIVRPALTILMIWGLGMAALRVVDAILNRITHRFVGNIDDKRSRDEREFYTSIYALRRLIVLVMVGTAMLLVLARIDLFNSVGMTLLASAGVVTVVLGIAGQAVLGNIIASLQIAFAKPVRIGDSVLFEGDWAYVEAIFYTFLRLRTWDHRRIIVPVTYFVSRPFENWSVIEARMMRIVSLRLDHRADVAEIRKKFDALLRDDPDVTDPDKRYTYATDHDETGITIRCYATTPDPSTGWAIQARLRERLVAFVRDEHPDWLPRERVMTAEGEDATRAAASAE